MWNCWRWLSRPILPSEGLILQTSGGQLKLQAVIYHDGDSGKGGHYTAACKSSEDQQWRLFNDMEVARVDHATVLHMLHASMLVYRVCDAKGQPAAAPQPQARS